MASRLNKRHQDMVRDKIRASQLINRLENHVLPNEETNETVDMAPTQITAALGLLKKVVPDLKATEFEGNLKLEFPTEVNVNVRWPDGKRPATD